MKSNTNINQVILFIHRHMKLIVGLTAIALFIGVFLLGSANNEGKADASTYNVKYFKCIDIEADDTLWSIADQYMSEEYSSSEDYIQEVKSINNLTSDTIYSGATLVIPYYAAPQ